MEEACVDCGGFGIMCPNCACQIEESGCEECGSEPVDCPICGGSGRIEMSED